MASARHSADGKRTKEAAANLKEKKDLEDKISGKTEMVTLLQKSLLLKEDRILEIQVTCAKFMQFVTCKSVLNRFGKILGQSRVTLEISGSFFLIFTFRFKRS